MKKDTICPVPWMHLNFEPNGKVVPCCFDKDAKHVLGNITTNSFHSIWKSDKYRAFRQAILKNRQEIDICKNCSEGTQVWS